MKNKVFILIALLTVVLLSCTKNWDDHYTAKSLSGEVFKGTLLDYIKSKAEYSKFYDALVTTGLDKELAKDQVMTIWIPTNDAMVNLPSDVPSLTLLLKNHINLSAIYDDKLNDVINGKIVLLKGRLKMLSKKHTLFTKDGSGSYKIDGALISGVNVIADNGVAHNINKLLTVRKSTFEYLMSLGAEYSTIKDTISKSNYRVFDAINSKATGYNKLGQVVYDTVWAYKNKILDTYDISNDEVLATLILSTNQQIDNAVAQAVTDFKTLYGTDPTAVIISKMRSFCARSFILPTPLMTYPTDTLVNTVNGELWSTKRQLVNPTATELSNGFVYNIATLKVPRYNYLKVVKVKPIELWNYLTTPLVNNKYSNAYHTIYSAEGYVANSPRVLESQSLYFESLNKTGNATIWEEVQSISVAAGGIITPQPVPAGEYDFAMEFRRVSGPPSVTVSVAAYGNNYVVNNNLLIESAASSTYLVFPVGTLLIPSQPTSYAQTVNFRIQINQGISLAGAQLPRISVSYFQLTPKVTVNNY